MLHLYQSGFNRRNRTTRSSHHTINKSHHCHMTPSPPDICGSIITSHHHHTKPSSCYALITLNCHQHKLCSYHSLVFPHHHHGTASSPGQQQHPHHHCFYYQIRLVWFIWKPSLSMAVLAWNSKILGEK